MAQIRFKGVLYDVPDDMSDEQIRESLMGDSDFQQSQAEQDAAATDIANQPEQLLTEPDPTPAPKDEGSFFDNFMAGLDFTDDTFKEGLDRLVLEDSFVGRAGARLAEKVVGEESDLVQDSRNAAKYEEWQPQIWDAQDQRDQILDKRSPEYTAAENNIKDLKLNFAADMRGEYVPVEEDEPPFDWGEFWGTVKDNKAVMLGALTRGIVADPELLVLPGGWTKTGIQAQRIAAGLNLTSKTAQGTAKIIGRQTGGTGLGAGTAVAFDLIDQEAEDPDAEIDFDRVGDAAFIGGGLGFGLPALGTAVGAPLAAGVRKVRDVAGVRAVKSIESAANQKFADHIDAEGVPQLNKRAALDQTVAELNISPEAEAAFRETVPDIEDFINEDVARVMASQAAADAANPGVIRQAAQGVKDFAGGIGEGWNNLTQPITSQLRNMGLKGVAGKLNVHDLETGTILGQKEQLRTSFGSAFLRLTPEQQALAKLKMLNSEFDSVRNQFPDEFTTEFDKVREALDLELVAANDVGIDIPGVDDFFPRKFDYVRFAEDQGFELAQTNEAMARAINEKLSLPKDRKLTGKDIDENPNLTTRHLTDAEIGEALGRDVMKGGNLQAGLGGQTSTTKARTVETISPEMLKYYDDPVLGLSDHFNKMTIKIQDRKFFGGKDLDRSRAIIDGESAGPIDDSSMMEGFINDMANARMANKDITPAQRDKMVKLLQARFVGAKQQTNKHIQTARNLMYAMTLGNPIAAATQLGDLGAAAYLNGVDQGVGELVRQVGRGVFKQGEKAFDLESFGLQTLPDPRQLHWSGDFLDKTLSLGGFRSMDRLGKETIMNSTWSKLKGIGGKPPDEARKALKARYGQRLADEEVEAIYQGILSGDTSNPHVRLAVFSDLTRVQPISMSEMPVAYLNHPNARIAFMLKTFTLKQIDLMRQEVTREITAGIKNKDPKRSANGAWNMVKLVGTIGGANMGVDAMKAWMRGDEVDMSQFGDMITASVLRNYGLSQYTLDEILRGQTGNFVGSVVTPPVSMFTNPILQATHTATGGKWGLDTKGRFIDSVPIVGRPIRQELQRQGAFDKQGGGAGT